MLRALIQYNRKNSANGLVTLVRETIDFESKEIEEILCAGENDSDYKLVGVEILSMAGCEDK